MVTIIEFLTKLFSKLPSDPFVSYLQELDDTLSQYIGYINWIVPVKSMFAITTAWATVIISSKALMLLYNLIKSKV